MAFEWFPKDERIKLQDIFLLHLFLGTFGLHQFYLGNRKRGLYLFLTTGLSHLLVLSGITFNSASIEILGFKMIPLIISIGYIIGAPLWLYDLITLPIQVRKVNRDNNLL